MQGDIYLVDLEPTVGHEQKGARPVVIISGDTINQNLGISIICPVSSKVKNYETGVIMKKNKINNLSSDSEVIAHQVRTISHARLKTKIGKVSKDQLSEIIQKLNDTLQY